MKLRDLPKTIEFNLRVPKYYKRTWIAIALVTIFLLMLASVSIIAIYAPTDSRIVSNLNYNSGLKNVAAILSYVSYGFIGLPYLFLSACWIVGIDNITKSKKFHIFIWIIYSLSSLISIIGIILCFRAYLNI